MLAGRWMVDGYDLFEAYKIVVTEADGLDVAPKVKKRDEHDWPDESGVEVDTATTLVYDPLDIKLQCYVIESTFADAVKRINGLTVLIASSGVHLLGSSLRKRLYPILLQEISDYKRVTKANADKVVLEFSVKLRCHMPENRMGVADVVADDEVTLVIPTGKDFTVWWGDGSKTVNTLTHIYEQTGIYTVLISGTGVTSALITATGVIIDEYSYPASGDITHVDVSPTSGEAYAKALEAIAELTFSANEITESKVLTTADANKYFYSTAATDITVTFPTGITKPVVIFQKGNGVVSFVAGSGVTKSGDVKTAGQNKAIYIAPESSTHYQITGGVA